MNGPFNNSSDIITSDYIHGGDKLNSRTAF